MSAKPVLDQFIQVYNIAHLVPEDFLEILQESLSQYARRHQRSDSDARYSKHIYEFKDDMDPRILTCMWSITESITKQYATTFKVSCRSGEAYNPIGNMYNDEGYFFYMYEEHEFCEIHVDQNRKFPRDISFIVMLNDDYEGGDIEFYCGEHLLKTVSPAKNHIVVFPSNFLYAHRVTPVRNGVRCVLVYWIRIG